MLCFDIENIKCEKLDYALQNDISKINKLYFLEGPPFISGKKDTDQSGLHIGHALISYIKSTIIRYFQKQGFDVPCWTGTDNHGLPMEMLAMDILGLKTTQNIINYGIDNFNKVCKRLVIAYENKWDSVYNQIGRQIDISYRYRTMDTSFMESVWWAFKTLFDKKLIYSGVKVLPYDCKSKSVLSNFEANQEYKDVNEQSIYVLFSLVDVDAIRVADGMKIGFANLDAIRVEDGLRDATASLDNTYFVAWTTTPWTLLGNIALCVNPKAIYVYVNCENNVRFIIQENCVLNIPKHFKIQSIDKIGYGIKLCGMKYKPLFNNFKNNDKIYTIICDDFVEYPEISDKKFNGSGIVHLAPAFGEIDYDVCVLNKLVTSQSVIDYCVIDDSGCYTVKTFQGKFIFDCNKEIIQYLKDQHKLLKIQEITHSYPFSPRTHEPLIYKICDSYFVEVTQIKEKMIKLCEMTIWNNETAKNRFIKWLENAKDWCISRNRYFGTPIPIWKSLDDDIIVLGSINELQQYVNYKITDIHPEYIKNIIIEQNGKQYFWIDRIFDCWFESGSVPFAQIHYPFECETFFDDKEYLSDFVCEGIDQTRGWFYTLLVLSTALFDKPAYKHVICSGLILDDKGKKFSKSSGNFITPEDIIEKYGSDATRMYLLNTVSVEAENVIFDENEIFQMKAKLIQYYNGIKVFVEYMNYHLSQFKQNDYNILMFLDSTNIFDKWIYTKLKYLRYEIQTNLNNYNIRKNIPLILDFIENFTNYYIKFNKERIKGTLDPCISLCEQQLSLSILQFVIKQFNDIVYPFLPFTHQYTFNQFKQFDAMTTGTYLKQNISYQQYVTNNFSSPNNDMYYCDHYIKLFDEFKKILTLIRKTRSKSNEFSSIRKVVNKITIFHNKTNPYISEIIKHFYNIIKSEANTINLSFDILDDHKIFSITLNIKEIVKDYKKYTQFIKTYVNNIDQKTLKEFYENKILSIKIQINDKYIELTQNHIVVNPQIEYDQQHEHIVTIDKEIVIDIDTTQNEETNTIDFIRKLIIRIQQERKLMKLHIYDKIAINIFAKETTKEYYMIQNNIMHIKTKLCCQNVNITQNLQNLNNICEIDNVKFNIVKHN